MPESSVQTKVLAGLGLVCVQTTVGVLYKASQAASGGFHYSTMSAVAIAEFIKLCMSCTFHTMDASHRESDRCSIATAIGSAKEQLSFVAVMHIFTLSFLYTFNNQLSFFVYTLADPGTIFLFKAAATMLTASIQCIFVGKTFSGEQWKAMMLQALGMIIVQHDPCQSKPRYVWLAYALMALSAVLSALCAVRNEYLVKNYKIGLNVQNATLYAGGVWMNLLAYFVVPNPNNSQASVGFFEGYDDPLAIGVVFANAMIGLAITAVYKYADAVTKCIASDVTAVLLCILSSFFFGLKASLTMWCGVLVVCFAVHFYTSASAALVNDQREKEAKAREVRMQPMDTAKPEPTARKAPEEEKGPILGKPLE